MQDLKHFFTDTYYKDAPGTSYLPQQIGASINELYWEEADIVVLGCGEMRGLDRKASFSESPDAIRKELYKMFNWHPSLKVADIGNIREGAAIEDTRAALRIVLEELKQAGKIVVLLGGSHDLMLQQYEAFKRSGQTINAAVADMLIDLDEAEEINASSYLMDMLTEQPNFIRHYSHIGFQSYYVHPHMLETLDKLRFDFYRLGKVREHIEDMEPVLRRSELFSFDISCVRYSDAPVNMNGSPNGFTGEEACMLTRYAGMSEALTSFGIYGFDNVKDKYGMTAKLIAQMTWYFMDGCFIRMNEAKLTEKEEFVEFHLSFTSNDTIFLKSKRSNRWWMQLPNKMFVPCSYNDYLTASMNEIPERWLREQERLV